MINSQKIKIAGICKVSSSKIKIKRYNLQELAKVNKELPPK
jgi:hypothetical protein